MMSPLRTYLVLLIVGLSAAILVACGDDGGSDTLTPTGTAAAGTPAASPPGVEATPTPPGSVSESGEGPIFYRSMDEFAGLRAREPYKVLFRIAGGYAEETISVSLQPQSGGETIELEPSRVEPQGEDLPGSYYPTNIEVPEAGAWTIIVTAGEASLEIPVEAAAD